VVLQQDVTEDACCNDLGNHGPAEESFQTGYQEKYRNQGAQKNPVATGDAVDAVPAAELLCSEQIHECAVDDPHDDQQCSQCEKTANAFLAPPCFGHQLAHDQPGSSDAGPHGSHSQNDRREELGLGLRIFAGPHFCVKSHDRMLHAKFPDHGGEQQSGRDEAQGAVLLQRECAREDGERHKSGNNDQQRA